MKTYQQNSLFRGGSNPDLNACVGTNGGPYSFNAYGEGFFEGGFQIIQSIKRGEWTIDLLVYPATYCFRHGIELYVKHFIAQFSIINNQDSYKKTHSLIKIWQDFEKQALNVPDSYFDPSELSTAKDIITDFCSIDSTGQVFRYPEDINGNAHLNNQGVINIEVLEDGMKILHNFFETWSSIVDTLANDMQKT